MAATEETGRRARTRRRLLDTGRELVAEKGVAGLRIQEITQRAGVALGSFYNHFPDKERLVEAIVAESLSELAEAAGRPVAEDQDPAEVVAFAIRRFIATAHADPQGARLVVHLEHADALFLASVWRPAREAVQAGVDAGRFKVSDVDIAVTGIVGGCLALIRSIEDGRIADGAEEQWAEMALRMLGVPARSASAIARRPLP